MTHPAWKPLPHYRASTPCQVHRKYERIINPAVALVEAREDLIWVERVIKFLEVPALPEQLQAKELLQSIARGA